MSTSFVVEPNSGCDDERERGEEKPWSRRDGGRKKHESHDDCAVGDGGRWQWSFPGQPHHSDRGEEGDGRDEVGG
jgi:hypothetical protein